MKNRFMKHSSRILAMILAASMVISLGADVTSATNVYAAESTEYSCGKEEHTHTDECYKEQEVETKELTCGQEEGEGATKGHEHSDDCYTTTTKTEQELICEETAEDHKHTDDCYETKEVETKELTCGKEEGEGATKGHEHSDDCYTTTTKTEQVLDCGKDEHEHTDACKTSDSSQNTTNRKGPSKAPRANAVDFSNYITKATFKVTKQDGTVYNTLPDTIDELDTVAVTLNYKLPTGTLVDGNTQITYNLADSLKNFMDEGTTGDVTNDAGTTVGTYTFTNGKIVIDFNSSFAANNTSQDISGYITFSGSASRINVDDQDQADIKISDNIDKTITINKETSKYGSIHVEKTATNPTADGKITYTITVYSQYGTANHDVTLTDVMTNIGLDGDITSVKTGTCDEWGNLQGETTDLSGWTKTNTSAGFDMTLPAMAKNTKYVITYTGVLPESLKGSNVTTNNKVTVKSTNSKGAEIKSEASVDKDVDGGVKKTGKDNGDGTITWTITVNENGGAIGGYKLQDPLTNVGELDGDITITDKDGKTTTITSFPYTFDEDASGKYTLTYKTKYTKGHDSQTIANTATLTKDGSEKGSSTGEVTIPGTGRANKVGTGVTPSKDGKTIILGWTISHVVSEDITEFYIWENLQNGQYFTSAQREAIKSALEAEYPDATVTVSKGDIYTEDTDGNWNGAYIKVTGVDIKKDTTITLSFDSTAPMPSSDTEYTNSYGLNANWSGQATQKYEPEKPLIEKVDALKENGGSNTEHDYTDLGGVLSWKIKVNIPEGARDVDYTIKETLPKLDSEGNDVSAYLGDLKELTLANANNTSASFNVSALEGDSKTATASMGLAWDNNVNVTATKEDNVITIKLPKELYNASGDDQDNRATLTITIKVALNPTDSWSVDTQKNFTNKVSIQKQGSEDWETKSQTQDITYNDNDNVVTKSVSDQDSNARLKYTIVVNPAGKTYGSSDIKSLTLTDVLKYYHDAWDGNSKGYVILVPNMTKVYKITNVQYNQDGSVKSYDKGEELSASEWSYKYTEDWQYDGKTNASGTDKGANVYNTIDFTLPNSQALLVEYYYKVSGTIGQWLKVDNTAELKANGTTIDSSKSDKTSQIREAEAGATTGGFVVYKCDTDSTGTGLDGAVFELYKWNGTGWDKVVKEDGTPWQFTSGSDGTVTIKPTKLQDGEEVSILEKNVAYRLVEITAPLGYDVAEDYNEKNGQLLFIVDTSSSAAALSAPSNFDEKKGMRVGEGGVIYMYNKQKATTEITVDKKWINASGEDVTSTINHDRITFELWRKNTAVTVKDSANQLDAETKVQDYTLSKNTDADKNWKLTISNLDLKGSDGYGNTYSYTYFVREVKVDDYETSYSENNTDGIVEGTITITNTEIKKYELPKTGGAGTLPYTLGGLTAILFSLLSGGYVYRRKYICNK